MGLNRSRILAMMEYFFSANKDKIQLVGCTALVLLGKIEEALMIEIVVEDEEFFDKLPGEITHDRFGIESKIIGAYIFRKDFFGGLYESTFIEGFECQTYKSTMDAYRHQADLLQVGLDNNIFILDTEETTTPIVDTINTIKYIKDFIDDIESKNKNNNIL